MRRDLKTRLLVTLLAPALSLGASAAWKSDSRQLFAAGKNDGAQVAQSRDVQLRVRWEEALAQKPEWYGGEDAVRIADNLRLYQRDTGGWPKNTDMAATLSEPQRAEILKQKSHTDSTIDNGATHTQMAFLARVFTATGHERFQASFLKGLAYLLKAQYENGGWPQFYPDLTGYQKHITFNDGAMIGVLRLLREIARRSPVYAFVDEARRAGAERAVARGVECILKTQIIVNGKRTVWCAQHDEVTLAPASARSYEQVSLSGSESVGIVRFLMKIERPDARVSEAIQAAVAWFNEAKLTGLRQANRPDPSLPGGYDTVIVRDASAGPLWARFYELGTNRPIFCGRDGVIKYSLAEIEHERRVGYRWYTDAPADLLAKDYPVWKTKWVSGRPLTTKQSLPSGRRLKQ